MHATTNGSNDFVSNSEVIDLHETGVICQPWPDHPVGTYGAVGGLFNDQFIICGGESRNGITNLCHAMTPSIIDNPFNLSIASYFSASVVLDQDTLLVSGGKSNQSKGEFCTV